MTVVSPASKIDEYVDLTMSEETIGSSVYSRIPISGPSAAAAANATLISSFVVGRSVSMVRSTSDPTRDGRDPAPLPVVGDQEGNLGASVVHPHKRRVGDDRSWATGLHDHPEAVGVIDVDRRRGRPVEAWRPEEPVADRFRRQRLEKLVNRGGVVGPDGPHVRGCPVA
jgi:hypothetical protein